jgi:hypothetical protein
VPSAADFKARVESSHLPYSEFSKILLRETDKLRNVETDRLVIRKVELGDAAFMLDLLNQPSFIQFIGDRGVRTIDDARTCCCMRSIVSLKEKHSRQKVSASIGFC